MKITKDVLTEISVLPPGHFRFTLYERLYALRDQDQDPFEMNDFGR